MQLTLARHPINEIRFGAQTRLDDTVLVVNAGELRRLVLEDAALDGVDFEIVRPGDSCRAGPIFDIVELRMKAQGSGTDFRGYSVLPPPPAWARPTCLPVPRYLSWPRCHPAREEAPPDVSWR